jgi:hypothetical protein
MALKCNLLCHFEAHIVALKDARVTGGNISAMKDYDRMSALRIAIEQMDETVSRATPDAKYGVHVADM